MVWLKLRNYMLQIGKMFFFENESALDEGLTARRTFQHYAILGLTKRAELKEIKENFRKLALKIHPDKGGDAHQFSKIREAYNILSNPKTRATYDQTGDQGTQENRNSNPPKAPTTETISLFLDLSLEEIYTGISKTVRYTRSRICLDCGGRGATATVTCSSCEGTGTTKSLVRMGPVVLENIIPCRLCEGTGETYFLPDLCLVCSGQRVNRVEDAVHVEVSAGTPDRHRFVFPEAANEVPGAVNVGDVEVTVRTRENENVKRFGNDVLVSVTMPLASALCGTPVPYTHLDGSTFTLTPPLDRVVAAGDVGKIAGKGMPKPGGGQGDLYVRFAVNFPNFLSPRSKLLVKLLLPMEEKTKSSGSEGDLLWSPTSVEEWEGLQAEDPVHPDRQFLQEHVNECRHQ